MSDDTYETPSTTPNFQTELAAQLAHLIPEAIADGKVDVEKLKELLYSDAADSSERFGRRRYCPWTGPDESGRPFE
jgi:adenine-specific DNA-methyltransferase